MNNVVLNVVPSPKTPNLHDPNLDQKGATINPGSSLHRGSEDEELNRQSQALVSKKSLGKTKKVTKMSQQHFSSFESHDPKHPHFQYKSHPEIIDTCTIAWLIFIVGSFLIGERILYEPIQTAERKILVHLQHQFGLSYTNSEGNVVKRSNFFFYLIANVQEFSVSMLICTHILTTIYFHSSPRLAIKLMFTQFSAWYLLTMIQLLYSSPQPFWIDKNIITYLCDQKYDTPSDSCYLFFMFFYTLAYQLNSDWSKKTDYKIKGYNLQIRVIYIGIAVLEIIYGAMVYISGQCFLIDLSLGLAYFIIVFSFIIFIDPWLDRLVVMFLERFVDCKHYIFYVLGVVAAALILALIVQYEKSGVENIIYIRNFFICYEQSSLLSRGFLGNTNSFQFNNVIGRTATFNQSSVLMSIVGICFSRFPQPHRVLNIKDHLLLHLSHLPFWAWALFQNWFLSASKLDVIGVNEFMMNCLFCLLLYIWVFRVVGRYIVKEKVTVVPAHYSKLA